MQRAQEFCVFEKKVPARWTSYKKAEAQSMGRLPVSLSKAKLSRSFLKEAWRVCSLKVGLKEEKEKTSDMRVPLPQHILL